MNWKWIAGFYEGEGWCGLSGSKYGRYKYLKVSITQKERAVLEKIRRFTGGRVYPSRADGGWKLMLDGRYARNFVKRVLPLMHSPKKIRQMERAWNRTTGGAGSVTRS